MLKHTKFMLKSHGTKTPEHVTGYGYESDTHRQGKRVLSL